MIKDINEYRIPLLASGVVCRLLKFMNNGNIDRTNRGLLFVVLLYRFIVCSFLKRPIGKSLKHVKKNNQNNNC